MMIDLQVWHAGRPDSWFPVFMIGRDSQRALLSRIGGPLRIIP